MAFIIRSLVCNSILVCFFMYVSFVLPLSTAAKLLGNESDHMALLAFKAEITDDPFGVVSSWNHSYHFCDWIGITCSKRHQQRVVSLNLINQKLGGVLSPHMGNLSFLQNLYLLNNSFVGQIPHELGRLFRLQFLSLASNIFEGEIPTNLTYCSNLVQLSLHHNKLTGRIPVQLALLPKLTYLYLAKNKLTGGIPNSLGNLSSLVELFLSFNHFEGIIPHDLARLQLLETLGLEDNQLNGTIPSQLYNLSNILLFRVSRNQYLQGNLPCDIGLTLPNLQEFAVGHNQFTGTIPVSLLNCSKLSYLELLGNKFSGPVPKDLGRLQNLFGFVAYSNNLGTSEGDDLQFLSSLTNCTNLNRIVVHSNCLRGSLPISIWNLSSQLEFFDLGYNRIYGSIPLGVSNLVNLSLLGLGGNNMSGEIPEIVGKLKGLQILKLSMNKFSGSIPPFLGNLTQLITLVLHDNQLNGRIPSSLASCQNLLILDLSKNNLTGILPNEIFDLRSLSRLLNISHNALTGPLPLQVGNLKNLNKLDVSSNKLSGSIPPTLGDCVSLVQVYMGGNAFQGTIPESLSALKGIDHLDLSVNNLTGRIPGFLGSIQSLTFLNLSFNDLEGAVPKQGVFRNASGFKLDGNRKLCGGILKLRLPLCQTSLSKRKHKSVPLKVIAPVVVMTICLATLACVLIIRSMKTPCIQIPSSATPFELKHLRISYAELVKATDNFSDANLLGVGSYGSIYKGTLPQDAIYVAVKVINLQKRGGSKSFMSECKALRSVRHRNLVKILTSCSSVDFQGNDFKALVFEFMPNRSLDKWLYPEPNEECATNNFNLIRRLNIAIDVASALDYLHHHSQLSIVHCDIKPSNVLLDEEMTAYVGDFGLAKILSTISDNFNENQDSSFAVKGSIGYVAPEYGMGSEVSRQGDVYSYGILLLEMFTGKRPVDEMFADGLGLQTFVAMNLPERVVNIIDPCLIAEEDTGGRTHECLVAVVNVGVACSRESPRDRMHMGDVVKKLSLIRDVYQGVGIH